MNAATRSICKNMHFFHLFMSPLFMKFWWKVKYNVFYKNQQCGLVVTGLYLELGDPWSVPGSHNELFLSLVLHCSPSQHLLLLFCPCFTSRLWHVPSRACTRISTGVAQHTPQMMIMHLTVITVIISSWFESCLPSSFASKHNSWCWAEISSLREVVKPEAGLPVWWSATEWGSSIPVAEIFRKKDSAPQSCFSVWLFSQLSPAHLDTSAWAITEVPILSLAWDYASLTTLKSCSISIPVNCCPYRAFSFSAQPIQLCY